MDLSGLKSTFNKEQIENNKEIIIQQLNKQKEEFNQAGINIDTIRTSILKEFRVKTEVQTKPFFKVAKKNNEKQTLKFIKEKIKPYWISILEKEEYFKDIRTLLNEDFFTYLTGLFIVIHSKNLTEVIHIIVDQILIEMFIMTATIAQKHENK